MNRIIIIVMCLTFVSCSVEEICGEVTAYGTDYFGGYLIISGDVVYVNDLFFSTVDVGDNVCVYE
tara:strand:+ start:578 stop:772 length:195 start_codon:yes stop_codon:yes gene_type:complete